MKTNQKLLLTAAIAGLFVSSSCANKAATSTNTKTEKTCSCMEGKKTSCGDTTKTGETCSGANGCGANGCGAATKAPEPAKK